MSFTRVLIANRGEIARRIQRGCRKLGLETVAVFSEADRDAPFVAEADHAVCIGGAAPSESYLNIATILDAARATGAGAVHPGYGFLSENAGFASAVEAAGLAFIGPGPGAIAMMGSKIEAKAAAETAGVPVLPGYRGAEQSDARLLQEAQALGTPFLVKASAGGGGRGMRLVTDLADAPEAIASARAEAKGAFGDAAVFLERYAPRARHVEVQVLGDSYGTVLHLGDRDCSLQRNHQKLIEEAPAADLPEAVRDDMLSAAVRLAQSIGYRSAGTVEYLYDPARGEYYFLEMNTRLQVEHPVTEAITGIDLVEWQLRIARGEALTLAQSDVRFDGHAIEVRIAAENPAENFSPETGRITLWAPPAGVRLDSGVAAGSVVGHHYDSMLAKLIVHAADRAGAIRRAVAAIDTFAVGGVGLNLSYQRALLTHADFQAFRHHTSGLSEMFPGGWSQPAPDARDTGLAAMALHMHLAPAGGSPWQSLGAWRITAPAGRSGAASYWATSGDEPIRLSGTPAELAALFPDGQSITVESAVLTGGRLSGRIDGVPFTRIAHVERARDHWRVHLQTPAGMTVTDLRTLEDQHLARASVGASGADLLTAPMPGAVAEVRVALGDRVAAGDTLVVLEAMKLLQSLPAPVAGVVTEIYCAPGDTVAGHAPLVKLDPEETT
ncbi:acetyl-CoA carboxylase subunit alpha [Salipiger aestuarii]|jgi:acetyl/propionyl-CoA carboxylase alpha subunit|uniref:3-methylcrotonyl-CoA carboxylase alpha subunit n=3 Tax=Salipiger TaxID=263377 RepID=A0A1G7JI67_9RHOB|nr:MULTISPECIES: biotin carboxylase N-terminal domain-containing protein [Roseobacteraceae]SDF24474.1 3-methylcrotonyl-CoA carboxylase alpha subunit [Salipiger thiooxidans]KAA8605918.1 acetyl-CoA carboxylase subunit alpha [Salipiger aestuarii]KAA8608776.1 acetyl-CoA carboxylase subunit alpha [Salipiger aestuarii]KAB2540708.1 acetyl-CoA carboxylase subunit alpha [Salipiger aestuarii]RAK17132.1 3-methylcrotonyl-CoA carboxylase alpha subunit/geranyl-CoA carboxylase alpha subunit [Salipiger aestua